MKIFNAGKERRDVAMTTQAEMILKKKREIEAKMASDEKKEKLAEKEEKETKFRCSLDKLNGISFMEFVLSFFK